MKRLLLSPVIMILILVLVLSISVTVYLYLNEIQLDYFQNNSSNNEIYSIELAQEHEEEVSVFKIYLWCTIFGLSLALISSFISWWLTKTKIEKDNADEIEKLSRTGSEKEILLKSLTNFNLFAQEIISSKSVMNGLSEDDRNALKAGFKRNQMFLEKYLKDNRKWLGEFIVTKIENAIDTCREGTEKEGRLNHSDVNDIIEKYIPLVSEINTNISYKIKEKLENEI